MENESVWTNEERTRIRNAAIWHWFCSTRRGNKRPLLFEFKYPNKEQWSIGERVWGEFLVEEVSRESIFGKARKQFSICGKTMQSGNSETSWNDPYYDVSGWDK